MADDASLPIAARRQLGDVHPVDIASFTGRKRIRKTFGKIPEAVQMPNLIEVQRSSYEQFLKRDVRPQDRGDEGLEAVFKSVFPIKDFNERAVLEYVSYEFEDPKYDVEECIQRDMTYAAPLKVKLRLIVFESDEDTGARSVPLTMKVPFSVMSGMSPM